MIDIKIIARLKDRLIPEILSELNKSAEPYLDKSFRRFMNPGSNPNPRQKSDSPKLFINTAKLIESLKKGNPNNRTWIITSNDKVIRLNISSELIYAYVHENGNSKTKARPFLKPGLQYFQQNYLYDLINKAMNKILK